MQPLAAADQLALLRIARRALDKHIRQQDLPPPPMPAPTLERPGGAFVTLHKSGALRGCIGRYESANPLYKTVHECALSAALHDPRFDPVRADEVPRLQIEISALSPLADVTADEVVPGLHGLLVSRAGFQGLLLPQVAVERGWDRICFLEQTCLKAGLDKDAWRRGARIRAFTAQVFAENERGQENGAGV
ncbi:MAG: AmmeMemoRadiSam system protein A [Acidobacteriota bacterium]|nr:AmmeMemoRadiSam system protein A [Acidobacteriota bacterium]